MVYAIVGSVTTAARLAKKLVSNGDLQATVVHTPPQISTGGCSYSVRFSNTSPDSVRRIANDIGIRIQKLYQERIVDGKKGYHAIS